MRGALSTVWFDRYKISRDCPEHLESIDSMCSSLGSIIQEEVNAGIPKHRVLIGMGLIVTLCVLHVSNLKQKYSYTRLKTFICLSPNNIVVTKLDVEIWKQRKVKNQQPG